MGWGGGACIDGDIDGFKDVLVSWAFVGWYQVCRFVRAGAVNGSSVFGNWRWGASAF
jgi:hypothetical protein